MKIKRESLATIRMVAGNEKLYSKVVVDGRVKEWVGIGWLDCGEATDEDRAKYPEVED